MVTASSHWWLLLAVMTLGTSADQIANQTDNVAEHQVEEVLERLLGRVTERAVERATERVAERVMERVAERALERSLDRTLREAGLTLACGGNSSSAGQSALQISGAGPDCERWPQPLPADRGFYQQPAVRACARSCLQLRDQGGAPLDGVYWLTGMSVPTLCDFSHDGGGWTLLLSARSHPGWDRGTVVSRAEASPSLERDYSILRHADTIRDLGTTGTFSYRIEALAETGRRRLGGVWLAPSTYSFTHNTSSQTEVTLATRFGSWEYKTTGLKRRMPWLFEAEPGEHPHPILLTTSGFAPEEGGWGSLLMEGTFTGYQLSSWSSPEAVNSGAVLYWMRERGEY